MKKGLLFAIITFCFSATYAQSFMHGVGINVFVNKMQDSKARAFGGFEYSPRVTFMETPAVSLSVGIPLSIGLSGSYNYSFDYDYGSDESNTLAFMFNAPLMVNFNAGSGATEDNDQRFGFFAGAGFGYHYQTAHDDVLYDQYGNEVIVSNASSSYGPAANIGFRIAVGNHHKNIETRFSYMKGLNDYKANIFGASVLFNF